MARLRFEKNKKKKKTWIFPLIAILLLYLTIPIILMNRGSVSIEKSFELLKSDTILTPTNEYYAGIAFYKTALVFPGFNNWANKKITESTKKLSEIYKSKVHLFKIIIYKDLSKHNITKLDSVIIKTDGNIKKIFIQNHEKEFVISDSLNLLYKEQFCEKWKKVFKKIDINKSIDCEICK